MGSLPGEFPNARVRILREDRGELRAAFAADHGVVGKRTDDIATECRPLVCSGS
jgi:hypothetical protein